MNDSRRKNLIDDLESHISEGGFFLKFRSGIFDDVAFQKVIVSLEAIDFSNDFVSKRIVAILWDYQQVLFGNAKLVMTLSKDETKVKNAISEIEEIIVNKLFA